MFDSHLHLDAAEFFDRLGDTARAMGAAGVRGAVNPAVDLASSRKTVVVHRQLPWVLPALGFHPLYLDPWVEPPVAELEELAAGGEYVAVGEIGLDFWRGGWTRAGSGPSLRRRRAWPSGSACRSAASRTCR
jgi:TatD DNase family protein